MSLLLGLCAETNNQSAGVVKNVSAGGTSRLPVRHNILVNDCVRNVDMRVSIAFF